MRRTAIHSRRLARGAAVAALVTGLMAPVVAHAGPPLPPTSSAPAPQSPPIPQQTPEPGATELPEATQDEKYKALQEIEKQGDDLPSWLGLSDPNFVFRVYDKVDPDRFPLTKGEAYRVYKVVVGKPDAPDATAFIRTGIKDFAARDRIAYAGRQEDAHRAYEARKKGAIYAELTFDETILRGTDQNFVYQVARQGKGPKLRDGAAAAWGGDAAAWTTFINTTLYTLHHQDQDDAIAKAEKEGQEAGDRLKAVLDKKNAAATVGISRPENDALWQMTNDNFIRTLLATPELADPRHAEVRKAAEVANLSTNPADWKAFIETGLAAADKRDAERDRQQRENADRDKVRVIRAKADNLRVRPRLVAAADKALAGTHADVLTFLSDTQYNVLNQSLMAVTPGVRNWHVQSGGGKTMITAGNQSTTAADSLIGDVTWKVVDGLADPTCVSFESGTRVGSYLMLQPMQVMLKANDGSDAFKVAATWCPKPGKAGFGVTLESKSYPGRFLRHWSTQVWAANATGEYVIDTPDRFNEDATFSVDVPDPMVLTQIMNRWFNDDNWRLFIGSPMNTGEVLVDGIRYRDFANSNRAYWSQAYGVHNVWAHIRTKYLELGGHKFKLPIQDSYGTPDQRGVYSHFADGISIYWTQTTGAHLIYGSIRAKWESLGWEKSYLGYPTTDEEQVGSLRRSTFEHGYIWHDPSTGNTWDAKS
nr:AbfB domain-containing protein [Kibdelosporangium sp. MJ126-NF4]CEL19197.1 Sporulation protein and related proteins [Kibdelosporangium sp. MJ126-NF4]CTQ95003.1 Sporulation protein and related proteins [Kibdelosporangium sp. MJ126-NF4]